MYKEVVFEEPKPVEEKEEEKPKKELFPVNDNDKELVKLEEGKPKFEYTLKNVAINAVILGCFANALSIFNFDPILQLDIYAIRLLGFRVYISEIIIVFIGICALYIHSIIDELVYPSFNHFTFLSLYSQYPVLSKAAFIHKYVSSSYQISVFNFLSFDKVTFLK